MTLTKKQIERKYDCTVHTDNIDGFWFYQACANDLSNPYFVGKPYGWNINELVESIEDSKLVLFPK